MIFFISSYRTEQDTGKLLATVWLLCCACLRLPFPVFFFNVYLNVHTQCWFWHTLYYTLLHYCIFKETLVLVFLVPPLLLHSSFYPSILKRLSLSCLKCPTVLAHLPKRNHMQPHHPKGTKSQTKLYLSHESNVFLLDQNSHFKSNNLIHPHLFPMCDQLTHLARTGC